MSNFYENMITVIFRIFGNYSELLFYNRVKAFPERGGDKGRRNRLIKLSIVFLLFIKQI